MRHIVNMSMTLLARDTHFGGLMTSTFCCTQPVLPQHNRNGFIRSIAPLDMDQKSDPFIHALRYTHDLELCGILSTQTRKDMAVYVYL
jgi:hypothetical protein